MEALILVIVIAYAVKKAAEDAHLHWQGAKAANRHSTKGQPVRRRAASAVQHDAGYWAHQVLNGFPQIRGGLAGGWHAGRTAQAQGAEARLKARTEHLERQARLLEEIREQLRRQDEAMRQIRAARQPGPEAPGSDRPSRRLDGKPETDADRRFFDLRMSGHTGWIDQDGYPAAPPGGDNGTVPVTPPTTEGTPMSGDTSYTQQMAELQAIRRDAEEEVSSVRRKRMINRLDILQSLGLDAASLAEAAAIDDALQAQEKAAQQTLDAADAAISGLSKRHGGIKEAVDSSPVDKPADPEFYQD